MAGEHAPRLPAGSRAHLVGITASSLGCCTAGTLPDTALVVGCCSPLVISVFKAPALEGAVLFSSLPVKG